MQYRYIEILQRIRAKVEDEYGTREERGHKALYMELGIEKSQWKRKWDGAPEFSWAEISALSEHFKGPPGWPFVSWEAACANERAMQILERFAPGSSPARGPIGPHGSRSVGPAGAAGAREPEEVTAHGRNRRARVIVLARWLAKHMPGRR